MTLNVKLMVMENGDVLNGIVWLPETKNLDISLFINFKNALSNYLHGEVNEVNNNNLKQLNKLKNIFIIDEHFYPHREFIFNIEFIRLVNQNKIRMIVFNTEKIFNQPFKHNLKIQKNLSSFEDIVQFLSDAQDIKKLGTYFPNKQLFSKNFNFDLFQNNYKIPEMLFIGQTDGIAYRNRRAVLKKIEKFINIPLKLHKTKRNMSYEEYLRTLANYKFILNPLGNGKYRYLNIRFYEAIGVKSIPVQQYTNDMLKTNKELDSVNVIKFKNVNDLKSISFLSKNFLTDSKLPIDNLEDYFTVNNLKKYLK